MVLGDEPGPVGEDLVDLVEVAQFRRDAVQALQPALVAALRHKLGHLLFDQVRALVPAGGLQKPKKKKEKIGRHEWPTKWIHGAAFISTPERGFQMTRVTTLARIKPAEMGPSRMYFYKRP